MGRRKMNLMMKSMGRILAQKRALQRTEKKFVRGLNAVLKKIGYQVVERDAGPAVRRRRRRRRGLKSRRKPGRPALAQRRRRRSRRPQKVQK